MLLSVRSSPWVFRLHMAIWQSEAIVSRFSVVTKILSARRSPSTLIPFGLILVAAAAAASLGIAAQDQDGARSA